MQRMANLFSPSSPAANSTTMRSALALFAALFTLAAVLALAPQQAAAQAEDSGVELSVPTRALHHFKPFQYGVAGAAADFEGKLQICAGNDSTTSCDTYGSFGWSAPGDSKSRYDSQMIGYRWHLLDGLLVDCADQAVDCWLDLSTNDDVTVATTPLRFSAKRPLPAINLPAGDLKPGEALEITTNEFLGEAPQRDIRLFIYQCPTATDLPALGRVIECTNIGVGEKGYGSHVYGQPSTIVPRRTLLVDGKIVDCATAADSCELVMARWNSLVTGTALAFEPQTASPGNGNISVSKTSDLTPPEKVQIEVATSLAGVIEISQCAQSTCDVLLRAEHQGDPSGAAATESYNMWPRRNLLTTRNGKTIDCAVAKCFIKVTSSSGYADYSYRIGKRVRISFSDAAQEVNPAIVVADGPYTDGQELRVEVNGLLPGMKVNVRCSGRNLGADFCDFIKRRGTADENGTVVLTLPLRKAETCGDPVNCQLVIKTKPKTSAFRIPVTFE